MKRTNRKLILGTVAVTALGVAGASVAASGSEQTGSANSQAVVAAVQPDAANIVEAQVASAVAPSNDSSTAEVEAEDSLASNDDGSEAEVPITGTDLEKAAAVALAYTGGGRVTETEVGDEESYYEVEVTLDDGSQIDVQLDENFKVVGASPTALTRANGIDHYGAISRTMVSQSDRHGASSSMLPTKCGSRVCPSYCLIG